MNLNSGVCSGERRTRGSLESRAFKLPLTNMQNRMRGVMSDTDSNPAANSVVEQVFLLPFPPSVNALYANIANVGRIKTHAYKVWRNEAGLRLSLQRPKKISGRVRIVIRAVPPDKRKRDLGNLEKAISDLLVDMNVIDDDSLIECQSSCWVSDSLQGISVGVYPFLGEREKGLLTTKAGRRT